MSERHLIGITPKSTGRTLAFIIPMLHNVRDQPKLRPGDGPIAIIMAVNHKLCLDIYQRTICFSRSFRQRCSSPKKQIGGKTN